MCKYCYFIPAIPSVYRFCYSSGNVDLWSHDFLTLMIFFCTLTCVIVCTCTYARASVRTPSDPVIIFSVLDFRTRWSCDNVTGDNVAGGQRAKGSQIMRVILIHFIFLKLIYLKTRAISRDINDRHDFILDSYVTHKLLYYGKKKKSHRNVAIITHQ